jgi:hypothetical protein
VQIISIQEQIQHYRELVEEMTELESGQRDQFSTVWLLNRSWQVVPTEDVGHFSPDQREHIVAALSAAGFYDAIALTTEPLGEMPHCYRLKISETDLDEFNRELGLFRFMLTNEDRSWAISCTESYNLFAGPRNLLEAMLGKSVKEAWQAYWDFIALPSMDPLGLLHKTASRYAALSKTHP